MTINFFTFGKSLASVQLAIEINKCSAKTRKKVSSHISEFNEGLNTLATITNKHQRCTFADLLVKHYINHDLIIKEPNTSFNFDTIMKNVIRYRYRLWLETYGMMNKKDLKNRQIKNTISEQKALDWIAGNCKNTPIIYE